MSNETRRYTKRRRAESEQETRLRITEAAVALHGSVGPARTTISAIADKAGVQRHTVYSHFPDEDTLFAACTSHWAPPHPVPPAATPENAGAQRHTVYPPFPDEDTLSPARPSHWALLHPFPPAEPWEAAA